MVGYDIREDFAARAIKNVDSFLGPDQPYRVEIRDAYEGIDETGLDRIVLDLPEPWRVVKHATVALRPGVEATAPVVGGIAELFAEVLQGSDGVPVSGSLAQGP